jgi:flagellar assembly factor FliW
MLSNDYVKAVKTIPESDYRGEAHSGALLERGVKEQELLFPLGILGFPAARRFRLQPFRPDDGSESPFFTLNCLEQDLSFPLIAPSSIGLEYQIPLGDTVRDSLRAASAEQLSSLLIVTLRERVEDITVNLQGPLVINTASLLGLQIVVESYPLRHPLLRPTAK